MMATEPRFAEFVVEQAGLGGRLTSRKMFGEYGFHLDGKFVALACDDSFFVKPTDALATLELELPMGPPYPGANNYAVADELLDNPERLRKLLIETAALLPEPKAKKPKRR